MNKWNQKRTTMRRYDLTAEMYETRYAEEQAVKYKAARKSLNINGDSRVLDVGCGMGLLFSQVAAKTQTVVGVDISSMLLRQAKEHARKFRNVHLVQADADHLPFISNYFNLVFAFTVLQNMPNPQETLSEIKRNATRDASIVVTGLKKAFPLKTFRRLLLDAYLRVVSLEDADPLKCYVAVTVQK
jgi:demethylmenaquinone methyltransferase/2-methoxy-6-polyprenyl-1,4-benzoquinol methylase